MTLKSLRAPTKPSDLMAAATRRIDELAPPLEALVRKHFPGIAPAMGDEPWRDIAFSLFFLERAQTAPGQTSATIVRQDLRRLNAAICEVEAALREMTPQTKSVLLGVISGRKDMLGIRSPNKFPLSIAPIGHVSESVWRQFRRACIGARRYVVSFALRGIKDSRPPDVVDLDGFAVALLPVWERCLAAGGASEGKYDPFNGSPKASRSHAFIDEVLKVVGLEAGPVAIQRAARHAAKEHAKNDAVRLRDFGAT